MIALWLALAPVAFAGVVPVQPNAAIDAAYTPRRVAVVVGIQDR